MQENKQKTRERKKIKRCLTLSIPAPWEVKKKAFKKIPP
jgi:hypothetical protein